MSHYAHAAEFTPRYLAYLPKLKGIIRHILGQRPKEDIEDILQDVWDKGARYYVPDDVRYFRTWLGKITYNATLQFKKDSAVRTKFEIPSDADETFDAPDTAPRPEEQASHHEIVAMLGRALTELRPCELRNVRLVHVDGLTHKEAARKLGIAVGTSKSLTHRGVRRLRSILTSRHAL